MDTNIDKIYQKIGEFIVSYQWIENLIRQIGWLIVDPNRKKWPPQILRDESNRDLIIKVEKLYCELIDKLNISDSKKRKINFKKIISKCHELRRYRNNLLHSAYIELKAGGEVQAIMRSNPKIITNIETGEHIFDQEILTDEHINKAMEKAAFIGWNLNMEYLQLIHWAPFKKKENGIYQ